jgi:hypothetical protein
MQFATEGQTGDCDPEANLLSLFIHKTKSNFYAASKLVEFTTWDGFRKNLGFRLGIIRERVEQEAMKQQRRAFSWRKDVESDR